MKRILTRSALFLFLLPVFFVLHGYVENFGLITARDCLLLLAIYIGAVLVVYGLTYWLYRNAIKAGLLSAMLVAWYLFFGAIHDFLKNNSIPVHKYSILLPLSLVVVIAVAIYLKRTKQTFYRLSLFLNVLLVVYLLVDLGSMVWKATHDNPNQLSIHNTKDGNNYLPCDSCANPDIYFLLFDEYSSSASLREAFGYNNNELDSFLVSNGFYTFTNSHSNYNFTSFSMASMLNMQYISGLKDPAACTIEDYAYCNNLIRSSEVTRFLSSRKYDIVNYSVFDLTGSPSLVEQSLLPVKTRLITDQTMYHTLMRDIGWHLYVGRFEIKWLSKNNLYKDLNNNNLFMELAKKESTRQSDRPRFVYVHFEMPHPPFYYDKNLHLRAAKDLYAEPTGGTIASYLGYLPYTNSRIMEIVNTIQQNTQRKAAIILMSDHGYRTLPAGTPGIHYFKNLSAVFLPGKEMPVKQDNISSVNQFRFILNTVFDQQLPMLKDSVILLRDKQPGNNND
jgi:hypothetical protein